MRFSFLFVTIIILWSCVNPKAPDGSAVEQMEVDFKNPPVTARPGVYWCWLNGNMSKESITRDLEKMKAKGINRAEIWDVAAISNPDLIPAGGPFLGKESADLIKHAIAEGNRLNIGIGIVASSGWNAGGSWVTPDLAYKPLFFSETEVEGPRKLQTELPFPTLPEGCPMNEDNTPVFYKDIAVLGVPSNAEKTLQTPDHVVNLTPRFREGKLEWEVPRGKWTILRFVCSNNGQRLIVPSPNSD